MPSWARAASMADSMTVAQPGSLLFAPDGLLQVGLGRMLAGGLAGGKVPDAAAGRQSRSELPNKAAAMTNSLKADRTVTFGPMSATIEVPSACCPAPFTRECDRPGHSRTCRARNVRCPTTANTVSDHFVGVVTIPPGFSTTVTTRRTPIRAGTASLLVVRPAIRRPLGSQSSAGAITGRVAKVITGMALAGSKVNQRLSQPKTQVHHSSSLVRCRMLLSRIRSRARRSVVSRSGQRPMAQMVFEGEVGIVGPCRSAELVGDRPHSLAITGIRVQLGGGHPGPAMSSNDGDGSANTQTAPLSMWPVLSSRWRDSASGVVTRPIGLLTHRGQLGAPWDAGIVGRGGQRSAFAVAAIRFVGEALARG